MCFLDSHRDLVLEEIVYHYFRGPIARKQLTLSIVLACDDRRVCVVAWGKGEALLFDGRDVQEVSY